MYEDCGLGVDPTEFTIACESCGYRSGGALLLSGAGENGKSELYGQIICSHCGHREPLFRLRYTQPSILLLAEDAAGGDG